MCEWHTHALAKVDPFGLWWDENNMFYSILLPLPQDLWRRRFQLWRSHLFAIDFESPWKLRNTLLPTPFHWLWCDDINYWKTIHHPLPFLPPRFSSEFSDWQSCHPNQWFTQLKETFDQGVFFIFFFWILVGFVGDPVGNSRWICDLINACPCEYWIGFGLVFVV